MIIKMESNYLRARTRKNGDRYTFSKIRQILKRVLEKSLGYPV